ncbi:MAG: carbamate kinase, partial [Gammaproteobacteria bacterium]|nr:carbamate kinase [Gammaproteobacteria bacterium]
TGHQSTIGRLSDLIDIMAGEAGTLVSNEVDGIVYEE